MICKTDIDKTKTTSEISGHIHRDHDQPDGSIATAERTCGTPSKAFSNTMPRLASPGPIEPLDWLGAGPTSPWQAALSRDSQVARPT